MPDRDPIIAARGLTRTFKEVRAVDDLDLTVPAGALFGLVGPDGAGKTTTLRLLAGLLKPTSGSVTLAGHDVDRNPEAVKPVIGYMAQRFSLYNQLSVVENLRFFATLFDVPPDERESRMERLLAFAGLTRFEGRRAAHLSGGMQKKLALACTLIHQPPVLLLDEPTTGVDPISRREFWNILTELHLEGTTIVVSTPYMDEADRCSQVGLMYAGRIVVRDDPAGIRSRVQGELIELQVDDWHRARECLAGMPGVLEVQTYGRSVHVRVDSARRRSRPLRRALEQEGIAIESSRVIPPRMETAFISLIRSMTEETAPSDVRA